MRPVCFKVDAEQMSHRSTAAVCTVCTCSAFACWCFCFRLLVGAPRAKALRGQTSNVTGGLYRCDLDRDDCSRVEFDNSGKIPSDTRAVFPANVWLLILVDVCVEDPARESKQMQWMGVSVSSQGPGGKVMVRLCDLRNQALFQDHQLHISFIHFVT